MGVAEMHDAGGKYEPMTGDAADKGGNPTLTVKVSEAGKNEIVEQDVINVSVGAGDAETEEEGLELDEDALSELAASENSVEEELELEEVELEEQQDDLTVQKQQLQAKIEQLQKEKMNIQGTDIAKIDQELKKLNDDMVVLDKKIGDQEKQFTNKKTDTELATLPGSMTAKPVVSPRGVGLEESIEFSEEELQELAEELKVDVKVGNLSDGYMGSTEAQKREQRTLEMAAARDDKATEDREAEMERMGDLVKENTELKKLNADALEGLSALKDQVEKLNVLNAKLLYTNKALVNISLNERQKNNIVESISKADSVLAAKTIYETVQNAVENNKQEREAPQSLRETLNKAATPFVVKKNANNSVNDLMAARMKALAGIK